MDSDLSIIILLLASVLLITCTPQPQYKTKHLEKYYQNNWCVENKGIQEYKVVDETIRVDCLTEEYAVEVEFAKKFYESVGQSLYYSILTGKTPAVLLILEDKKDELFLKRLNVIASKYNIKVFTVKGY